MHRFTLRVYYSDTDCGGIVYHARYLDFAEHARSELLRDIGIATRQTGSHRALMEQEMALVVKSANIDYQSPAYLDDLLTVETEIETSKRFSIVFRQTVKREGETLCVILVKVAAIDTTTMRPKPMPEWFVPAFSEL
ncbi:MAG TPA: tol-pal system-associated acyl-CoA thioesterase [Sphaerochaeta sp.]|jgi:acyl-CoA thioester hydrolase|nr:tol-pal system-associated acyl-CoA thioesterase [Sphaerochaeta sp.]